MERCKGEKAKKEKEKRSLMEGRVNKCLKDIFAGYGK
jgi:hypothetical protein